MLLGGALLPTTNAQSDGPRPALDHYNLEKGLALEGYDPVAYFPEGGGEPTEGERRYETHHRGVTYRFASEANRSRFLASPGRFEPAYGGWCAYAMSGGDQAPIDPESFLIEEGRLLVFYKGLFNNTRKKWLKEGGATLRPKANANWAELTGERAGRDTKEFNLDGGLALAGYDPVSYRRGSLEIGEARLSVTFQGVTYHFASEASRDAFLRDPAAHEPHYGGWCAWAMSQGKKVPVDPKAFVQDDQGLFLFYNADKRDEWLAARRRMTTDANKHWKRITG